VPIVDAVESVPKAIVSAAREPIRILTWLQDAGTQLRIAKLVVGGALTVGALMIFARPAVDQVTAVAGKAVKMVV